MEPIELEPSELRVGDVIRGHDADKTEYTVIKISPSMAAGIPYLRVKDGAGNVLEHDCCLSITQKFTVVARAAPGTGKEQP